MMKLQISHKTNEIFLLSFSKSTVWNKQFKGSFSCGDCLPGFIGDPKFSCEPLPECGEGSTTNCDENAQCIVVRNKAYCQVTNSYFSFVWK